MINELPSMVYDLEANEVCAGFYRRGTLDVPGVYITGFIIAADEADQEISWLLAEGVR